MARKRQTTTVVEQQIIKPTEIETGFKVKIIHPSLRVRKYPSIGSQIMYMINDMGIYHINEEKDGWGKLDDNNWIMLQYTEKV